MFLLPVSTDTSTDQRQQMAGQVWNTDTGKKKNKKTHIEDNKKITLDFFR